MSVQDQIDRITGEVASQTALIEQTKTALAGKATGGGDSTLPNGYVRCSFIRFEKAQYIDTGIVPTEKTTIKVLFTRELTSSHYLYGVTNSDNTASVTAYLGGTWRFGAKSAGKTINTDPDLVQCAIVGANGITMPNNSTTFSETAAYTAPDTLLLGTNRTSSGSAQAATYQGNIPLWEILEDGVPVQKLIPVVKDGVYRFYDEVSGEFFDSKTSTPLSGGNW